MSEDRDAEPGERARELDCLVPRRRPERRGSRRPGRRDHRELVRDLGIERMLDLRCDRGRPGAPMRLATRETRSRSKPSRSIVSSPMRTFFSDVTSGLQMSSSWSVWSSAASIAAVEERPGVDDDCARTRCAPRRAPPRARSGRPRRPLRASAAPAAQPSPVRGSVLTNARSFSASMSPADAARSAIVARGVTASVSAESPNCRSRSTRSVRTPERAVATARFVASDGLAAAALRREDGDDLAGARSPSAAIAALRIANRSVSAGCGRTRTSAAPTRGPSRRSRSARRRRRG